MDLIQLSREKGFISRDNLITVNASYYYLWMCELQKWFREVHNIDIHPSFNLGIKEYGGWSLCVTPLDYTAHALSVLISNRFEYMHFEEERTFHTYEEALEAGLQETLKLIKLET